MAQAEDALQLRANEIAKSLKGPLPEVLRMVERLAEDFPSDKDFHFYNNFPQFKSPVQSIQSQAEALLNEIGLARNFRQETSGFPIDPDESYDWLVSLQDDLVEGIDAAVDQLNKETSAGKRSGYETPRKFQTGGVSPSGGAKLSKGSSERRSVPFHVKSIPRPQNKFVVAVDNSNTPFKHPQAPRVGAQKEGLSYLDLHARKLGATFEDMHPLEDELTRMEYVEPKMLEEPVPQDPRPIAETPLMVVSTLPALNEMASKCKLAGEIAVDLENHNYRSFQGFVCLMQVSTRSEDFIVDTLALRSHIGPCLKDVFADARIRKVLHGADRDIVWLQRDFGIYVCNMFDTGQAARVLQLEGFGLAFLMQQFLNMSPDKRYQLADWRIRPLPADMIKYAREDTHYLLYLYDLLRVQLVSMRSAAENDLDDPLLQVYKRSRDICLQMYKKDILTETSYLSIYGLQDRQLNPMQMSVLAGLYGWRDKLARKLDESTGFVLPNQLLFKLAEEMPNTARTLQTLIRGPHSLVGQHAAEVLEVIKQSKEKAVMSGPGTSLSVPEKSETKSTPVTEASDELSADMNTFTTQAAKAAKDIVSTDVSDLMEEDVEPVSTGHEDVDTKSSSVVGPAIEKVQPGGYPKFGIGGTTSIKVNTAALPVSAQVMVSGSSVENSSPAPPISSRKLNAAVVKRASAPSLALFRGSSKKKVPAPNVSSSTEAEGVVSQPVELNAVETSPGPGTSILITHSDAEKPSSESCQSSKLANAVVEDVPEVVIVTTRSNGAEGGNEGSVGAVPSSASSFALSEKDSMTGATGAADQAVEGRESASTPMVAEGGTGSVTSVSTSVALANGLIEREQVSKSAAAGGAPSQDAGCRTELCGSDKSSSGCHDDDGVKVAAEEGKIVNSAEEEMKAFDPKVVSSAVSPGPTIAAVNTRSVSGVARQGLGTMLGFSALRKRQKKSNEDMEMVAAKLRANRIHASVSLPFHQVPEIGEQDAEMLSGSEITNQVCSEPGTEPANSQAVPLGQEAAPFEVLGDYVRIGNTTRDSGKRSASDITTKDNSNWSNDFDTEEESPFPRTLGEMRRQPTHHERGKQSADSSTHQKRHDKQKGKKSGSAVKDSVEFNAEDVVFQPFDYEAARREAGLGENLVSRKDDSDSGRGRGRGRPVNPNRRQKQLAPPSTGGPVQPFDPLRRARQEPRPDGIPAAKRRQVFPQSGNRTASFRR